MEPVVGIFSNRSEARQGARDLRSRGFRANRIELLLPGMDVLKDPSVPTEEAEQPGVGQAVGGVLGAATGASAGFGLGAATASLLVPGLGAVTAVGIAAAALLGVLGAAGGAAAGDALEDKSREGIPKDEAYLYENALMRGKSILFVMVEDEKEAQEARRSLKASGAESLDSAREAWWVGIRQGPEGEAETPYRRGFLAALAPELRGKSYEEAVASLPRRAGDAALSEPFRRGFARGCAAATARADRPRAAKRG